MTLHQVPVANKDKVIIVGAGIGGLASSLRLSHLGYDVEVIERANSAGGKLRTITGSTGEIDIGPTVLTLLPIFQKLFKSVGEDIFEHVDLVRQKIIARHWWPDGTSLDLHDDFETSRDAIMKFSGSSSAIEFEKYFCDTRDLFACFDLPVIQNPRPSILDMNRAVLSNPKILPSPRARAMRRESRRVARARGDDARDRRRSFRCRDVVDAVVDGDDGARARVVNVNGVARVEVSSRASPGARAGRVGPVDALRAACACATAATFESRNAREAAEGARAVRAMLALVRMVCERRATRDEAIERGVMRRTSTAARGVGASLAAHARARRGRGVGAVFASWCATRDIGDVTAIVRSLLEAYGSATAPMLTMFPSEGDDGAGGFVEEDPVGDYLSVIAAASDCTEDVEYRMACLRWFARAWFDEASTKSSSRPTRRDALNAVAVLDGATRALEKHLASDGDRNAMDGLEKHVVVIAEMLRFIALDDAIDDYFDKDVLGERSLLGAIESICRITRSVLSLYTKSASGDVNESLAIMLVYLLEIVELFTADTNAYEDIGTLLRADIVAIFSMPRAKFIQLWSPHGDIGSRVTRHLLVESHANTPAHTLSLFRIVGNFHDVDLGLVETSVALENLLTLRTTLEGEVGAKAPTQEEMDNFALAIQAWTR